jgi:hypothetical protein
MDAENTYLYVKSENHKITLSNFTKKYRHGIQIKQRHNGKMDYFAVYARIFPGGQLAAGGDGSRKVSAPRRE